MLVGVVGCDSICSWNWHAIPRDEFMNGYREGDKVVCVSIYVLFLF